MDPFYMNNNILRMVKSLLQIYQFPTIFLAGTHIWDAEGGGKLMRVFLGINAIIGKRDGSFMNLRFRSKEMYTRILPNDSNFPAPVVGATVFSIASIPLLPLFSFSIIRYIMRRKKTYLATALISILILVLVAYEAILLQKVNMKILKLFDEI